MADSDKLKELLECYFTRLEQILSFGHKTIILYSSAFISSASYSDDVYEKLFKEDPRSPVCCDEFFSSLWENPAAVIGQGIASARARKINSEKSWLLMAEPTNVVRCVHSIWHMKGLFYDEFHKVFPECRHPEHIPFVLFFKEFQKHSVNPLAKSLQSCLEEYDPKLHTVNSFCGGVLHGLVKETAESVRGMLHIIIQTARYKAAVAERSVDAACNGTDLATNGDAHSVCWRDILKVADGFEKSIVDLGFVFGWSEIDYDGSIRKQLDAFLDEFGYDTDDD